MQIQGHTCSVYNSSENSLNQVFGNVGKGISLGDVWGSVEVWRECCKFLSEYLIKTDTWGRGYSLFHTPPFWELTQSSGLWRAWENRTRPWLSAAIVTAITISSWEKTGRSGPGKMTPVWLLKVLLNIKIEEVSEDWLSKTVRPSWTK